MTPQVRRRLVPLIVLIAATSVLMVVIFGPKNTTTNTDVGPVDSPTSVVDDLDEASKQSNDPVSIPDTSLDTQPEDSPEVEDAVSLPTPPPVQLGSLGLQVFQEATQSITLGSLHDLDSWQMEVQFVRDGAGISSIRFSDIFETVNGKLDWNRYRTDGGDAPPDDELYKLTSSSELDYLTPTGQATATASVLGASQIIVNGQTLHLTSPVFWNIASHDEHGVTFEAFVIDESGNHVARIERSWSLSEQFGLHVDQSVQNLSADAIDVQWLQYGPPSLTVDRSRYMDRRRFRFGWELSETFDPDHAAPIQSNDFLVEYSTAKKQNTTTLWPTEDTIEEGYNLSWFASTNRYFALAIFPNVDEDGNGNRTITNKIETISSQKYGAEDAQYILTAIMSPHTLVASGESFDLSMGVYAGPLKRSVLDTQEPYITLNMRDLVLYQMSSMCAFCTFQWLADFLAMVLTTLDKHVVFDWGFAIILLVLLVRTILHPITKKSQINMQRFGKVMQKLKPEIDRLKAKYPNEPKKVQAEQMALMQKFGVNPFQMLGCLPMFLQMPIWIALYALLYFMFDIRQEPAFFGVFQQFGNWPFLADLSASDHFFGQFSEPKHFLLWNITGINVLPLLMGVIFYIQQKYMSPSVATTKEQESQQKIMRIMMVVMFPLMLYSAPSGLTLYILTSSSMGIIESRRIRKQIDSMDIEPNSASQPLIKRKKPKDKQGRAWADAMDARRKKVQNKAKKRNTKKRS